MPAGKHSSVKKGQAGRKVSEFLNENQARRLRITCTHIDRILGEIEGALEEPASGTAFPSYIQDLSADQRRIITDNIPLIRSRLVDILENNGIAPEGPQIPVTRAIRGRLYSIDIAAEEIRPKHMKAFGKVSESATAELDRIADDLQQVARYLDKTLDNEKDMDL